MSFFGDPDADLVSVEGTTILGFEEGEEFVTVVIILLWLFSDQRNRRLHKRNLEKKARWFLTLVLLGIGGITVNRTREYPGLETDAVEDCDRFLIQ